MEKKSVFETLMAINCDEQTEKKGKFTYLSWSVAWEYLKKAYPEATQKVYKDSNGCFYHNDGHSCWVEVGVTIEGIEHIEYLPIIDSYNKSIALVRVSSQDANKAIQRASVKAIARHGLALNVYKGEDYPEETDGHTLQVCLGDAEVEHLQKLFKKIPSYYKLFLKQFKIQDLKELQEDKFDQICEVLGKRIEIAEKQGAKNESN